MRKNISLKKGMAVLLTGALMLGMTAGIMPGNTVSVQAEGNSKSDTSVATHADEGVGASEHKHCFCGKETKEDNGDIHNHSVYTTWEGISSLDEIKHNGCYYLKNNITLTSTWENPWSDVKICLNGYNIIGADKQTVIKNNDSLSITDCHSGSEVGKITHKTGETGRGIENKDHLYMYNGCITGNTVQGGNGAGVYNESIIYMSGGSITHNTATKVTEYTGRGGGVYNDGNYAMFEMRGHVVISNNTAEDGGGIYNYDYVSMYGNSAVKDNIAVTGGGVWNGGSSGNVLFEMFDNSSITGNQATTHYGGGVYTCDGYFYMYGNASIADNKAPDGVGGGVYHSGRYFRMKGGSITGNRAAKDVYTGGGIYVNSANEVELEGKVTITGNTAGNNVSANFHQESDHVINAEKLEEGSSIGIDVSYERRPKDGQLTILTNEGCNPAYFTSDDPQYMITTSGSAVALAVAPEPAVKAPVISSQPQNVSVKAGEKATFTVTATGTELAYQWQIDRNDGNGFVDIGGANSASYTTGVTDKDCNGFKYQCIISNTAGSVTTDTATLTVTENTTPVPYKIIEGANSTWTQNKDGSLAIRGDGEITKFQSVKVDGAVIDPKNYTVTEGSTIITLKAEYLKTLSVGSHTFEIVWTDGSAGTSLTIAQNTPGTNDTGNKANTSETNKKTDLAQTTESKKKTTDTGKKAADTKKKTTDTKKKVTDTKKTTDTKKSNQNGKTPSTGDAADLTLLVTLLMASLACLAGGMLSRRKKNIK